MVEAVVRGEDGILAGARDGLIVIDTTTAEPSSTMCLHAKFDELCASDTTRDSDFAKIGVLQIRS